jgi:S1-C subfamily serine protease
VTITQAGFGEDAEWEGHLESHALGMVQNMQELALFLETGVAGRRFMTWKSDLGMGIDETPAGARVRRIDGGGFAEQAGMKVGDYVLEVAGVPVFGRAELWAVSRSRDPGERVDARFVHDGEVRTGSGALGK